MMNLTRVEGGPAAGGPAAGGPAWETDLEINTWKEKVVEAGTEK